MKVHQFMYKNIANKSIVPAAQSVIFVSSAAKNAVELMQLFCVLSVLSTTVETDFRINHISQIQENHYTVHKTTK